MTTESRRHAGVLLLLLPTVIYGGVSLLGLLSSPAYRENALRQDLWRAGHAHAGVLLVLSLVVLLYLDQAALSKTLKRVVSTAVPSSAILLPAAFFLSVLGPNATAPNGFIYLAYPGAAALTVGLLILGVGLLRKPT